MRSRTPLIRSSVLYLRRLSTISRVSTMIPSRSRARIEGFSTFSAGERRAAIKPPTPIRSEPKKTTTTRKNRIWERRFRNCTTEFMTKLFLSQPVSKDRRHFVLRLHGGFGAAAQNFDADLGLGRKMRSGGYGVPPERSAGLLPCGVGALGVFALQRGLLAAQAFAQQVVGAVDGGLMRSCTEDMYSVV